MQNDHYPTLGLFQSLHSDFVPIRCPFSGPHRPLLYYLIPVHLTDGFDLLLCTAVVLTQADTVCLSTVPEFIE